MVPRTFASRIVAVAVISMDEFNGEWSLAKPWPYFIVLDSTGISSGPHRNGDMPDLHFTTPHANRL